MFRFERDLFFSLRSATFTLLWVQILTRPGNHADRGSADSYLGLRPGRSSMFLVTVYHLVVTLITNFVGKIEDDETWLKFMLSCCSEHKRSYVAAYIIETIFWNGKCLIRTSEQCTHLLHDFPLTPPFAYTLANTRV